MNSPGIGDGNGSSAAGLEPLAVNQRLSRLEIGLLALGLLALVAGYWSGLQELFGRWMAEEEYGHGLLLPFVAVYFAWQEWPRVQTIPWRASWLGVALLALASAVFLVGEISALYLLVHYAFIASLFGLILTALGPRAGLRLLPPVAILLFAIPIPYFLQALLSARLQLWSSALGVKLISLFSIPVYLDGNVIDLGVYQLQVVEACSGLRYLFPLMSLGFIVGYLYKGAWWKRVVIFLSTIPITLLMNSFRIGMVGLLVDGYGIEMAEGFMHDFEGWVIFGACLLILLLEMWLLSGIGGTRSLAAVFADDTSGLRAALLPGSRKLPPAIIASLVVLVASVAAGQSVQHRDETVPLRKPLVLFPDRLADWQGRPGNLTAQVIDKLKLTDYYIGDFRNDGLDAPVNFYVAYYENQRKGASPHSPAVCIPGGGWEIAGIKRAKMPFSVAGRELRFNRVEIRNGQHRQLVYYWFQQRGRIMANEYEMKWFLFLDALKLNRTDGALVRLVTAVNPAEGIEAADKRLEKFAYDAIGLLPEYVPD